MAVHTSEAKLRSMPSWNHAGVSKALLADSGAPDAAFDAPSKTGSSTWFSFINTRDAITMPVVVRPLPIWQLNTNAAGCCAAYTFFTRQSKSFGLGPCNSGC